MMAALDIETWIRLFVWLFIGFVVYFGYSRTHSHLARASIVPSSTVPK